MDVVNSIKQGDTLESISIERIGDEANQFKANEESFNSRVAIANEAIISQKELRQIDFENYANSTYPDAYKNESGYFTVINKQGDGNLVSNGQIVSVDIALKANSGQVMREAGSPIKFTLGSGDIISAIDSNVIEMSIGESRTILATYEYVFGDAPSGNIPQDSFIIFDLLLISVEGN
jgi:peptidylprolyl isomerase